jgi:ubiquitin-protein ligase E3 C
MFDGNFRSKREVNLGSNARRGRRGAAASSSSSGDKNSILKQAEAKRKQRQEQQRQDRAARRIQRSIRGWETRRHVAQELQQQPPTPTVISMRLSLTAGASLRKAILLEYSASASSSQVQVVVHKTAQDSLWFSRKRIAQAALSQFQPQPPQSQQDFKTINLSLFFIIQSYFSTQLRLDIPLYIDLLACCKSWWTIAISCNSTDMAETTNSLLTWSFEMAQKLQDTFAWSLLASVIMGTHNLFRPEIAQRFQSILPKPLKSANADAYTTWFLPLASIFDTPSPSLLLQATLQNISGQEAIVLSNALDLCQHEQLQKPHALVHLLHHVLRERSDLAMLASLVVRGEDLNLAGRGATSILPMEVNATNEVDDDDNNLSDSEESDHETTAASSASATAATASRPTKNRRSSTRYNRQELLTLVKLDKLYQDSVLQGQTACLTTSWNDSNLVELAQKIGTTAKATWLQWGLQLLDPSEPSTAARDSYLALLGLLLQSSTGLKANTKVASSLFLSQLAFSRPFLETLWAHVQTPAASPMSVAVFCDVTCHYLIALSDVEFLKYHTTATTHEGSTIIAQQLIEYLRGVLYELYWNKPVLASDVNLTDGRGRLLLSGTKLWKSLYERWNRLVRHVPFCDESTWWFPHLSSREGDGAVITSREQRPNGGENDPMDLDDSDNEGEGMELSAADAETDALADSFRDPKMARVLTCIPQALPFERRVKLFHSLLQTDKLKTQDEAAEYRRAMVAMMRREEEELNFDGIREKVQIRRKYLYNDSMQQLNALGPKLKRKVQVSFINQHGAQEAGIDGGGVFKEFLDDLIKDGFTANGEDESHHVGAPRLFSITPLQTLAVNSDMTQDPSMLEHYEFLGRVLGKALYESILVEPQFCLPFLNQLLGKPNSLEDLKNFDAEYYTNLTKLRFLSEAEIDSLGLTFDLTIGDSKGSARPRTVELVRGGQNKAVTKQNVIQYIHLVAHQRLNVQGALETRAFLRGFRDLIPASWVRLFSANELQKLIGGDDSVRGIDVASLKRAMQYAAGYHPSQPLIQAFWEILDDFTPDQQRKFLKFMTSCSRQPLLGFASLEPAPCIQQIRLPETESTKNSRLPTSSTCMNLLKLPNYPDKELMRSKLIAAIEAGAGFELT